MPGDYEYSEATQASIQELKSFLAEKDAQPPETDEPVVDAVDTQADTQVDHTADQPVEEAGSDSDHRYKSLQGKYNAETKELRESNAKLQQQLSELITHLTANKQPATQQEEPVDNGIKDLEELGESSTYIHTYVSKQLEAQKRDLLKQIEDKLSGLTAKLDDTAMSVIESRIAPKIDGYNELIGSPDFAQFLSKRDPISGVTYQALLADATRSGDEERVVAIINAAKPKKDPTPVRAKPNVAPPKGTAAAAKPTTQTPVVYDQKFMDDLQKRIQRKEFNSPEGRKELERINREMLNSIK